MQALLGLADCGANGCSGSQEQLPTSQFKNAFEELLSTYPDAETKLSTVQIEALKKLGPIAKDGNGDVVWEIAHSRAIKYCAGKGGLPTARQWAELGMAFGARGIFYNNFKDMCRMVNRLWT